MSLRDNLRKDKKYITSWVSAGWTNDVMTYSNLLYLALITDRIPILAKFNPSHIGGQYAPIKFSEVFDLPRLRQLLRVPILEWDEVKNETNHVVDDLGCWAVWPSVQYNDPNPRASRSIQELGLDISYTDAPKEIKIYPGYEHDQHCTFWSLATLAYPRFRNDSLQTPHPSPMHQRSLPPDEHLVCYDYLYYVAAYRPFEFEYDYSPSWRYVAQYMRWAKPLENIADSYVRKAIGVSEHQPTPPYVGIHVRHNDFENWCFGVPKEDCFAPVSVIARRVREVQEELRERKGLHVPNVIMTSDEKDPKWWAEVSAEGWFTVDHSKTAEIYGPWYPVLIDAIIQSNGEGFVGTDRSTMSIMARRRVESWRDGATRTVLWGTKDADDH